jgi:hypothetical protein
MIRTMEANPAGRRRGALAAIGVALVLGGAYFGVTSGVRWWVNRRLDATHGQVLEFTLRDTDGNERRAAEERGKTVVLNLFRSHCSGCLAERDAILALGERLDPARAVLFGVLLDAVEGYAPDVTARTLAHMGYRHPVLVADRAFVDTLHGAGWAHVTPITYIVGGDGRIVRHLRGHQTLAALLAALPAGAVRN